VQDSPIYQRTSVTVESLRNKAERFVVIKLLSDVNSLGTTFKIINGFLYSDMRLYIDRHHSLTLISPFGTIQMHGSVWGHNNLPRSPKSRRISSGRVLVA